MSTQSCASHLIPNFDSLLNRDAPEGFDESELTEILSLVQCNILRAHRRQFSHIVPLRFRVTTDVERRAALDWLAGLDVTSDPDQQFHGARGNAQPCVSVALSAQGFSALGRADLCPQDDAFLAGMDKTAKTIEEDYRQSFHALIVLAHDELTPLKSWFEANVSGKADIFCQAELVEEGARLWRFSGGDDRSIKNHLPPAGSKIEYVEHFRYVDGISQPRFFKDKLKNISQQGSRLSLVLTPRLGSFLVYQKLHQRVERFLLEMLNLAVLLATAEVVKVCRSDFEFRTRIGNHDDVLLRELCGKLGAVRSLDDDEIKKYLTEYIVDGGALLSRHGKPTIYADVRNSEFFRRNFEDYLGYAGAMTFGRFTDGQPIVDRFGAGNLNDFSFASDPDGAVCPFHAHIRRMNARMGQQFEAPPIVRRGITYGGVLDKFSLEQLEEIGERYGHASEPGAADRQPDASEGEQPRVSADHEPRGLHFMSFQSALAPFLQLQSAAETGREHFESNRMGETLERDPIAGFGGSGMRIRPIREDADFTVPDGIKQCVELRGGDYYYAPSLPELKVICSLN